jgi:8-oxo-dGTP diphosphatase
MTKKSRYVYDWPRPMVSVDAAVFSFFRGGVELLLIKRKKEPFKGHWALPGGFVGIDEELAAAAERELAEETGLGNVALEQMHTFGRCGRDPRGRQITIAFMGVALKPRRKLKAGDDAAEAKWFDIEKLPGNMAFDHDEVVRFAIRKLKRQRIYRISLQGAGKTKKLGGVE